MIVNIYSLRAGAKEWMVICLPQPTDGRNLVSISQVRIQVRLARSHSWAVMCLGHQSMDSFSGGPAIMARGLSNLPSVLDSLAHQPFASGHLARTPAWANLLPRSKQPRSTKCPHGPTWLFMTMLFSETLVSQVMKQKLGRKVWEEPPKVAIWFLNQAH